MTPTHGQHFDEFRATAHDPHGPQHDEFGNPSGPAAKHGAQHDDFDRQPVAGTGSHGELWDDFGWVAMPAMHGQNFDSDFAQPAALDGGEHGTWHDVFRGGTQVRYIKDGCDYEGVTLNTGADHVIVQPSGRHVDGGARHELGLGQIKELRWATQSGQAREDRHPTAAPGNTPAPMTDSPAQAPSAHDATAQGGGRRGGVGAGQDSKFANKTVDATVDELRKLAADLEAEDVTKVKDPASHYTFVAKGATFHAQHGTPQCGSCATKSTVVSHGKHYCASCDKHLATDRF